MLSKLVRATRSRRVSLVRYNARCSPNVFLFIFFLSFSLCPYRAWVSVGCTRFFFYSSSPLFHSRGPWDFQERKSESYKAGDLGRWQFTVRWWWFIREPCFIFMPLSFAHQKVIASPFQRLWCQFCLEIAIDTWFLFLSGFSCKTVSRVT